MDEEECQKKKRKTKKTVNEQVKNVQEALASGGLRRYYGFQAGIQHRRLRIESGGRKRKNSGQRWKKRFKHLDRE
jgi:hypothetical protein